MKIEDAVKGMKVKYIYDAFTNHEEEGIIESWDADYIYVEFHKESIEKCNPNYLDKVE
jgi:hypothetical protein